MGKIDIVTIVIIAANVLISYKGFNDFSFFEKYKFNVGGLRRGEQIRMFSSGFLHVDMQHLLFNMVTLYFFSGLVIFRLGTVGFLTVYIGSLLIGNFLSYYFHKDEYDYSAVGASGAVMGIIYSAILFDPMMKINFFIPGFAFGIGYLLYSIYGMKKRIGNIGHDAHFGGAVGGYILTLILAPYLFQTSLLFVALLAIPIIILFIMQRMGKI
ncbi:rhomboid family intramembrane serine protease [Hyunsoonleella pacifica]|uniref:Rhomboid family intramembrane serine protease n=1 Tax=Hyunsoonleella pacifica TaxID=1080224 RepID=A0A4Q9FXN4_9FLAO|nr:rhomboid family intramembrane serine protease [Hyunsoonleella pacifica]TBN19032.1 rhomboid family intramembrane serine protease [Hyunsoonleella pacifica]GGD06802.1 rhomboid family intramembrane serine protease [Hyunsoonleella pacifica]